MTDTLRAALDALPMPNAEGQAWISLFVPKEKPQQTASSGKNADMNGDEIPF